MSTKHCYYFNPLYQLQQTYVVLLHFLVADRYQWSIVADSPHISRGILLPRLMLQFCFWRTSWRTISITQRSPPFMNRLKSELWSQIGKYYDRHSIDQSGDNEGLWVNKMKLMHFSKNSLHRIIRSNFCAHFRSHKESRYKIVSRFYSGFGPHFAWGELITWSEIICSFH